MSIFGRGANQTAPTTVPATKSVTPRAEEGSMRLVTPDIATRRTAPPTISMTNGSKKSPVSFASPMTNSSSSSAEVRKLTVGREIAMAGEITACDYLVVEGTLDATLRDGQRIEINQSGLFRGAASVEEADIAGRFEGELSVRGRLRVRGSGKISGRIQYGELEVEAGGQIMGEMVVQASSAQTSLPIGFSTPANSSSANEDFRATGTNN